MSCQAKKLCMHENSGTAVRNCPYQYFVLHRRPQSLLFVCCAWPCRWVRRKGPRTVLIALRRRSAASTHHGGEGHAEHIIYNGGGQYRNWSFWVCVYRKTFRRSRVVGTWTCYVRTSGLPWDIVDGDTPLIDAHGGYPKMRRKKNGPWCPRSVSTDLGRVLRFVSF